MYEVLRTAERTEGGDARAAWLLDRLQEEIGRSVSAPLASELRELLPSGTPDVRAAYAGLLGWTESLVSAMLLQLAGLSERLNLEAGRRVIGEVMAAGRPMDGLARAAHPRGRMAVSGVTKVPGVRMRPGEC